MLTLPSTEVTGEDLLPDARPGYRPYRATVAGIRRLSPHFVRVTFTGPEFEHFGTAGLDQRIKLVLPIPGVGLADFGVDEQHDPASTGTGWYDRWRALPEAERNPFRSYTVRRVRPHLRELDVDFVSHDAADAAGSGPGPASRWLAAAQVGEHVVIVGPDSRSRDAGLGLDWRPGDATYLLLAGDETAVPAICGILDTLQPGRTAHAFLEVPDAADQLDVRVPDGCTVTWLPRGGAPHGECLDAAVRTWVAGHQGPEVPTGVAVNAAELEIDIDRETLWDTPDTPPGAGFYAWLAGEAGAIKRLRRFLVSETGVDRRRVSFMGYWRLGKAEPQ
ncbi:siderophore-interacting protein [Cryobacterium glucosi]|uniref:Siderophore-interacting protein n=1 Tax=Cryobacterium glucosi TaxID=1259175 RepID=A0ABY2IPF7_9MICO|nr:siderophore-interacting protein [Cryobacterium glucosi]TFC20280.1 siderophore-interacting protein [Cryobacterium glucosi]